MIKLIGLLGSLGLVAATCITIVSCGSTPINPEFPNDFNQIPDQNIVVGESAVVSVTPKYDDSNLKVIKVVSSNEKLVTVTLDGLNITITSIAEGKSAITISADGYKDITFNVKVNPIPKKYFNPIPDQNIVVGESTVVSVTPNEGDENLDILASSSEENVVNINTNGLNVKITGVAAGASLITISADGYNDIQFLVIVNKKDLKADNTALQEIKNNKPQTIITALKLGNDKKDKPEDDIVASELIVEKATDTEADILVKPNSTIYNPLKKPLHVTFQIPPENLIFQI